MGLAHVFKKAAGAASLSHRRHGCSIFPARRGFVPGSLPGARAGRAALLLVLPAVLLLGAPPARAHEQAFTLLDVDLDGAAVHGSVSVHVEDLAPAIGLPVPDSLLDETVLLCVRDHVHEFLAARIELHQEGRRPVIQFGSLEADRSRRRVSVSWDAMRIENAPITLETSLFPEQPSYVTYATIREPGRPPVRELLDGQHRRVRLDRRRERGAAGLALSALGSGVHHIFTGPDHVLFILGLVLAGGAARRLLKIATAFTLAHSVTLALAVTGVFAPSPRIVEPAIAASIVAIGAENLLRRRRREGAADHRVVLAFAFGLLHGFGFAGALLETTLPPGALAGTLLGFNTGVELGQAVIVLAIAPLLLWLHRGHRRASWKVVAFGSAAIIAAGGFWFVRRLG